jgi:hypothetical protein
MKLMTLPPILLFLLTLAACPLPAEDDTGTDTDAPFCSDVDENGEPGHPARVFYLNNDGDDFGDGEVRLCHDPFELRPDNYSAFGGDCDDDDPEVHPDADEVCDGTDNDCDGEIDVDAIDAPTWHADEDGDGYGDPLNGPTQCDQPPGHVANNDDCDDASDLIYPGAQGCE